MKNKLLKVTSYFVLGALFVIASCNDEDRVTPEDQQDITEEATTDAYFQDADDMAGIAISADNATAGGRVAAGARTITIQDERFNCSGVVVEITPAANSTSDIPKGTIVVNFGTTGCADAQGNVRKGKIIFTYSGRRFMPTSTVVTTLENYSINGIKLEGTRTLTNVTGSTGDAPKFNVTLTNGKATFEDQTVAERTSNITFQWDKNATPLNFADDKLIIEAASTASGKTRAGRTYAMSLTKQLEYKRFCGIATSGIKIFVIDGKKTITIDYGNGECDKQVTVTINGVTRNLRVNN
jgi:hypothetical protein